MTGCNRCALKVKRKKKRKEKEKGGKNGDQNRFCLIICAVVIFQKYIKQTVPRLRRSYPLLFAIKILMVSQFGDV